MAEPKPDPQRGIVVDQDGAGARDIGVGAGRIAAIGELQRSSAGETSTAAAFTFCRRD